MGLTRSRRRYSAPFPHPTIAMRVRWGSLEFPDHEPPFVNHGVEQHRRETVVRGGPQVVGDFQTGSSLFFSAAEAISCGGFQSPVEGAAAAVRAAPAVGWARSGIRNT